MRKTLLIAAASLFVVGQALAQGQTPPPSDQKQEQKATQQQTGKNTKSGAAGEEKQAKKANKAKRGGHRMAHNGRHHRMAHKGRHHRMAHARMAGQPGGQPMMMGGFGGLPPSNQKLVCKKGEKPNGITCM